jgi:N-acetylglucosamine kinase-like BadF-type ATPase
MTAIDDIGTTVTAGGAVPHAGSLPAVLAIDGGGSKTDVALVAPDGTMLAKVRGPSTSAARQDLDTSMSVLAELVASLRATAGRTTGLVAQHTVACMTNADLPEEEERLAAAIAARGWSHTVQAANDTYAVMRSGLDGGPPYWGVAVVCGSGINCVAVAPDGRTVRYLALGQFTGDWGGGHGLGAEVMWWSMRAEDGRGPQTALREAVLGHFGTASVHDAAVAIHRGDVPGSALLTLTRPLFAVAAAGDQVAAGLVRRLAEEVAAMALSPMRRLGMTGLATPVVLGGGLLTARDPLLTTEITERIARSAPDATIRIVDVPPVIGAAKLGLDAVGAGQDAARRLHACAASSGAPAI